MLLCRINILSHHLALFGLQMVAVPMVMSKQSKRMNVLICHIYIVNDVGEDNNEIANGRYWSSLFLVLYDSLLQHNNY